MCGIFGFFGNTRNIHEIIEHSLEVLKHRGPDAFGVLLDNEIYYNVIPKILDTDIFSCIIHLHLKITDETPQPLHNETRTLWLVHNGEIYNYNKLRDIMRPKHVFYTKSDSEALLHAFEEGNLSILDGNFAAAIYDSQRIKLTLIRDPIGIRPLFYGFDKNTFYFASEKKVLRRLCSRIYELEPGNIIEIERDGKINVQKFDSIVSWHITRIENFQIATSKLKDNLINAVRKRSYPNMGLLFSGGIDSLLIAEILRFLDKPVTLYTAGLEDAPDIQYASKIADMLGYRLRIRLIDDDELEDLVRKVIYAIEDPNPVHVTIGIPIFAASQLARKDGIRVLLSGQGADELFGGYARYLKIQDKSLLEKTLLNDLLNTYKNNLDRDDHCTMANSIEVRYPYLDKDVIKTAISIPIEFKIRNSTRKVILRKIGLELGLPKDIVDRPKKAIQYGSRVTGMLKKMAKRYGGLRKFTQKIYKECAEKAHG